MSDSLPAEEIIRRLRGHAPTVDRWETIHTIRHLARRDWPVRPLVVNLHTARFLRRDDRHYWWRDRALARRGAILRAVNQHAKEQR